MKRSEHTLIVEIGNTLGLFMAGSPKYLLAFPKSIAEYAAFAGSFHGGWFPVATFTPPRKIGTNSMLTPWEFRASRCLFRKVKA